MPPVCLRPTIRVRFLIVFEQRYELIAYGFE
jgi:hypothetical protein